MALTLQQLIIDAKKLANRLKDDESKSDILINQAKSTHNQIEAMKQVIWQNAFCRFKKI